MGFFSRLFGSKTDKSPAAEVEPVEYKGFKIYAQSQEERGQYRIAGRITKQFDDEVKTHQFIRSDMFASQTDADELMVKKAEMFIDQMGDKIFG
ncbi:transcriptional regulator [Vibrio sp. SM6]|uniref:Transcriptional regulator n=1 Tax=Vibrio agarilyticus TaxID=2726741 RepID=A0A7X8TR42_9VIBR|nr:transcriptional regulator [Vibrio agarilyticus]